MGEGTGQRWVVFEMNSLLGQWAMAGPRFLYGMHPDHRCCPGETKQRNQKHCNHPPVDSAGFRAKEKIEH